MSDLGVIDLVPDRHREKGGGADRVENQTVHYLGSPTVKLSGPGGCQGVSK